MQQMLHMLNNYSDDVRNAAANAFACIGDEASECGPHAWLFTKTAQARKQGGGREGWREGRREPGRLFLSIQILSADKIAEVEYVLQWNWCLTPICHTPYIL